LPLWRVVIFLRQRGNILAGVPQRQQFAAAHLNRIIERSAPAALFGALSGSPGSVRLQSMPAPQLPATVGD
jgi:hypothetical protein